MIARTKIRGVILVGAALGAIFCYLFVVGDIKRLELQKPDPAAPALPSPIPQPNR